jgi:hypothetical protein
MSGDPSEQAFWSVIERARAHDLGFEHTAERVYEILAEGPVEAIVAYDQGFARLQARSYTWALWGAAYLINGGCSDDGFEYFRGWLLTQGQAVFEAALADPDSLAGLFDRATSSPGFEGEGDEDEVECEEMLYVAGRAYEALTGETLDGATLAYSDLGEGWDFDDAEPMRPRYPKLWARFGWDPDSDDASDDG